jgi:tetratricopeptide (TPR) repeat protein
VMLGNHKFEYNADPNDGVLDRPKDTPKDFDWGSVYGLYLQGKEDVRQKYYATAETKLRTCLKADPNYMPALTELSMLMYRAARYSEGYDLARRALAIDTYDGAANYAYGLNALELGKLTDARDGFDLATLSPEYRGAAYTALSEIYLKSGDLEKTLAYIEKGLDNNRNNLNLLQYKALVFRLKGDKAQALLQLQLIDQIDPLNHFVRFERYLLENSEQTSKNFTSLIRNELPQETFLELGVWYFRLGLNNEAEKVFELAPANAEIRYWQAYLAYKAGKPFQSMITSAAGLSPNLVFPFRTESAEVLKWATTVNSDWQPTYYLALISMAKNDSIRASQLLASCGEKPDYAPFYATRALLNRFTHPNDVLTDFRKAAQLAPTEWRYGKMMIEWLVGQKNYAEALNVSRLYAAQHPDHVLLNMLQARVLMLNQKYKESIDLLAKFHIIPFEGSTDGRNLWRENWLMLAVAQMSAKQYPKALASIEQARAWPENLGVGKPYPEDLDEKAENWLKTLCVAQSNHSKATPLESNDAIIQHLRTLMGNK